MQTLASASNQALKTIAKTKFERVIFKTRHYHKVMSAKYGDAFNPHGDDTILSAINDITSTPLSRSSAATTSARC